jgi:hypothetical protein
MADQCASGFCADLVCCDAACTLPDQRCNVPGREGECLSDQAAPAPATSNTGLLIAAGILIAVAYLRIRPFRTMRRR